MVSEWITSDLVSASCSKEVIDRPLSTGAGDLTPNGIERENPHWHAVDAAYRNLSGIRPVGHFQIIRVLNLDRRVAVLAPLLALLLSDLAREALYRTGLDDQWGLYYGMWTVYGVTALVAVHPRAVEAARRLKPGIPPVGNYGIPIRDEIELERRL